MKTKTAVLSTLLFMGTLSFGQGISFGVKGGIPLTEAFTTIHGSNSEFVANTYRYTVGPTVEFHFPLRLSLEVDALYSRLGYDSTDAAGIHSTTRANSWQFPVLGKFEILPGPIRPFVDAGASFRNISGIERIRGLVTSDNAPEFNKRNDIGFTAGFGIAFKIGIMRISPEFRYTRWGGEQFRDPANALLRMTRNDGTFLVGLTF